MKNLLLFLIKLYQKYISAGAPGKCRYEPTCSVYFAEALREYGFFRGSFLGAKRILRCHPFYTGGYDPLK